MLLCLFLSREKKPFSVLLSLLLSSCLHSGVKAQCTDQIGFIDSVGDGCSWYAEDPRGHCAQATFFTNADGISAREACCVCEGAEPYPPCYMCGDENLSPNFDIDVQVGNTTFDCGDVYLIALVGGYEAALCPNVQTWAEDCGCGSGGTVPATPSPTPTPSAAPTEGGGLPDPGTYPTCYICNGDPGQSVIADNVYEFESDGEMLEIDCGYLERVAFNGQIEPDTCVTFGLLVYTACGCAMCTNIDGWVDSAGDDCAWYQEFGCGLADGYANNGVSASDACCVCDGGTTDGEPTAPFAPVAPVPPPTPAPVSESTPTASPVEMGEIIERTITGVTLEFDGAGEIPDADIPTWQRLTEEWFEGYFQQNFRRGLQQALQPGNTNFETTIRLTNQNVSVKQDGSSVNTVVYEQMVRYVMQSSKVTAEDYIPLPFVNSQANKEYADTLRAEIDAFASLEAIGVPEIKTSTPPPGPPTPRGGEDIEPEDESSAPIGAIIGGIAAGALVISAVVGGILWKKRAGSNTAGGGGKTASVVSGWSGAQQSYQNHSYGDQQSYQNQSATSGPSNFDPSGAQSPQYSGGASHQMSHNSTPPGGVQSSQYSGGASYQMSHNTPEPEHDIAVSAEPVMAAAVIVDEQGGSAGPSFKDQAREAMHGPRVMGPSAAGGVDTSDISQVTDPSEETSTQRRGQLEP